MTNKIELPTWICWNGTPAQPDFVLIARGATEPEVLRNAMASGKATADSQVGRIVPKRERAKGGGE